MPKGSKKAESRKDVAGSTWSDTDWNVVHGKLTPSPGRPRKVKPLFKYVAEKLPFDCLKAVKKQLANGADQPFDGVYFAHDSLGVARYGGRGNIFSRLERHKRKYPKELLYFSFYVIEGKNHEREIETAILRAAGPQMILNTRKVRDGIEPGNVKDYEPGTRFFERQRCRGRRVKPKRAKAGK